LTSIQKVWAVTRDRMREPRNCWNNNLQPSKIWFVAGTDQWWPWRFCIDSAATPLGDIEYFSVGWKCGIYLRGRAHEVRGNQNALGLAKWKSMLEYCRQKIGKKKVEAPSGKRKGF
jgi:hypothetical protein